MNLSRACFQSRLRAQNRRSNSVNVAEYASLVFPSFWVSRRTLKTGPKRGFTLLEVMVAVAILGLGLTAILSAQAGVLASANYARNVSVATGLVRCKMTELEEHLQRDGFQELDESNEGDCCERTENSRMRCSWKIEKPKMPEPKYGELNLDTDLSSLGALGNISQLDPNGSAGTVSSPAELAQSLAGGTGDSAEGAASVGGVAQMVMDMVYPDLKALFEASIRRVTVKLTWTEGTQEKSIELTQWITNPQKAALVTDAGTEETEE